MKSGSKKVLGTIVLLGLGSLAAATVYYDSEINQPLLDLPNPFLVERGDTLSSLARDLLRAGNISEPYTLKIYARLNDVNHIKAGEYKFPEHISLADFVRWLEKGKGQVGIKVTIVEGWTFKQMRGALATANNLKQLTTGWTDQDIMTELGYPDDHPEGQFYPDTYQYRAGDSDLNILRRSFELMRTILDDAWLQRKPDIQIKNTYEALIMASIIEKESQVRDEQPEISGVFDNRLRMGMRLQTDPTVIYGVGDAYAGDITRKHLKTDTPYNTYTRYGLPPTPISLPGEQAILSAVNPMTTEALYFVAKGEGRHQFSKTLKAHNAAVKKYLLSRKKSG